MDPPKEDSWIPLPTVQKTQDPEGQTHTGSGSESRASLMLRLQPPCRHRQSKDPRQCYFIIIDIRYKQIVQKGQQAPVPLQAAPVNKQENRVGN